MSEVIYYERYLAPLLGLARTDLIYLRNEALKKKEGLWGREGRDVVITQAGLELILARLRASDNHAPAEIDFSPALVLEPEKKSALGNDDLPAAPTAPQNTDVQTKKDELEELKVVRLYPNPRMLRAALPDGSLVDVRVKTNKNFVPNMTLRARMVCPGKYEMEGRCPRTRGRY